jgi:hypothetical protein
MRWLSHITLHIFVHKQISHHISLDNFDSALSVSVEAIDLRKKSNGEIIYVQIVT